MDGDCIFASVFSAFSPPSMRSFKACASLAAFAYFVIETWASVCSINELAVDPSGMSSSKEVEEKSEARVRPARLRRKANREDFVEPVVVVLAFGRRDIRGADGGILVGNETLGVSVLWSFDGGWDSVCGGRMVTAGVRACNGGSTGSVVGASIGVFGAD